MKKLLLACALLMLASTASFSQVKISDFPTYSGNPAGGWVPVVIANTNRKADAANFGKIDSIDIRQGTTYDTVYAMKMGVKVYYKLVRAGSVSNLSPSITSTSVTINNSNGTGVTIPVADGSNAGPVSAADYNDFKNRVTGQRLADTTAALRAAGIGGGEVISPGTNLLKTGTTLSLKDNIQQIKNVQFNPSTAAPVAGAYGVGNSIMFGLNASTTAKNLMGLINTNTGLTVNNYGVSSRESWQSAANAYLNINPGHNQLGLVMTALNDVRRNGWQTKTVKKIENNLNAIFVNHFLKSFTPAGNSVGSIVRSGSGWGAYLANTVGGKTGNGSFTNVLNDSITYTFTDSTVVLGLMGADGSATNYIYANFDFYIDGVLQGTFTENNQTDGVSDGNNDNKRSPMAMFVTGLSLASHKIKLINKTTAYLVVDYFGHLQDAATATPLFVFHCPHLTSAGYATAPNLATDAVVDSVNKSTDSTIALFPAAYKAKVYKIATNSYFSTTTGMSGDGIHPNDTGFTQYYTGFKAALDQTDVRQNGSVYYDGTNLKAIKSGAAKTVAMIGDFPDSSSVVLNQVASAQAAAFHVGGISKVDSTVYVGSNKTDGTGLIVRTGPNKIFKYVSGSGMNYWQMVDSTAGTGLPLRMVSHYIDFQDYVSGTFTPMMILDNTATYKMSVPGTSQIANAVFGTSRTPLDNVFVAGTNSGGTAFYSLNKTTAPTDQKIWAWEVNDTSLSLKAINDPNNNANYAFQIVRSGFTITKIRPYQKYTYSSHFSFTSPQDVPDMQTLGDSCNALRTAIGTGGGGSSSTLSQPQKDTINHMMDSAFNAPANSFSLRNSKATGDTIFRGTSNPNQGLFKTINVTSADGTITIVKTKTDSSWAADISTAGIHDSGTPTVVANSGAGTGATVSITGTDRRGTITVTAGTSPTAGQSICSLTFNTAYSSTPFVIIQASNTLGGSTNPIPRVSATPTTTTFSFISDPTAGLVASTVYKFTYIVVQ